jgi:glycosyltransferase involved in cell wall biosynthesis
LRRLATSRPDSGRRKKIAWYTPFHGQSGIGRRVQTVAPLLSQHGYDVVVIRSEDDAVADASEPLPTPLPVLRARDLEPNRAARLRRFDAVLYSVGNNYGNHRYAVEHQGTRRGVVLLCDRVLNGFVFAAHGGVGGLLEAIEDERGEKEALRLQELHAIGQIGLFELLHEPPLWRFAVKGALAVIVHSTTHQVAIEQGQRAPVLALPLPAPTRPPRSPRRHISPGGPITLLTFGHIAVNKRCHDVVAALGGSVDLRERCTYVVAGTATDMDFEERMSESARELGVRLERRMGYLDEDDLVDLIDRADVVLCLRSPLTEGGSGTLLDALHRGKPTIVLGHGVFSELPPDVVVSVDPADIVEGVREALLGLIDDPVSLAALGDRAAEFADDHYSRQRYAGQLAAFLRDVT